MNQSQINLLNSFGITYDVADVSPQPDVYEVAVDIKDIFLDGTNEELYEFWDNNGPIGNPEFQMDYDQEIQFGLNATKIHRYSRTDRFKFTVYQLLGSSGEVPRHVKKYIKKRIGSKARKTKIWNQVRSILKEMKLRRYYNRIPQIIYGITKQGVLGISQTSINGVLNDFAHMHIQFNSRLRSKWKRSYFPNLRFIALKLFQKHGISYPYKVPLVRTLRKRKYLNSLYEQFE